MKSIRSFILLFLLGATASSSFAQTISPSTPKGFDIRKSGSGTGTGSSVGLISPSKKQDPQVISYTALTKDRDWTNTEGKVIKARLLAFPSPIEKDNEDTKAGKPHFTVILDQKIRFLMSHNNQAVIYPLDKLSDPDQQMIKEIAKAASPAATSPPPKHNDEKTSNQNGNPSSEKK